MISGNSPLKQFTGIKRSENLEIEWSSSSDEEYFKNRSVSKCIQTNQTISKEDYIIVEEASQPSRSSNANFTESPIIGSCQLSPVLKFSVDQEPTSPIIGKKKRKLVFEPSPDLFSSESTNKIKLVASPSKSEINYEILSVSSQDIISPEITTINIDTGSTQYNPTSTKSSDLYFNLSEKRKHFIKEGLAYKAHQTLLQQRNDSEIFKHEMYLSKEAHDSIISSIDEDLFVVFKVSEVLYEFGLIIVKENETALLLNDCFKDKISVGSVIKIYPPYILKKMEISSEIMKVYFNVSKFVIE